jgi:hypothetical protein
VTADASLGNDGSPDLTAENPTGEKWSPEGHLATDGPYAEAKEQLAGFFLIDCASRERAEEIAAQFAQPGGTVELRPVMRPGGDDQ